MDSLYLVVTLDKGFLSHFEVFVNRSEAQQTFKMRAFERDFLDRFSNRFFDMKETGTYRTDGTAVNFLHLTSEDLLGKLNIEHYRRRNKK